MIPTLLVAFVMSLILSVVLMPLLKVIAHKVGLVDRPDSRRKLHAKAIPLVGGIVMFVTTLATSLIVLYRFNLLHLDTESTYELVGLIIASSLLLLVGIIDDRFSLRGRQKLFGQIIVATVLIGFGYTFKGITIYGWHIDFGQFALLLMYAWILGGINSVNLLDGADGFATSLGILMSGGLCVMAYFNGNFQDAVIAAALCGSLIGVLVFNFPPASAYLGDAGSMLIGMVIAALAIRSAAKQPMAYAFFAPVALLAIPMIDTCAAIIRRRLTGKSIYSTDRGHLHHTLMRKGLSPRLALLWFAILCSTTVVGATLSSVYRQSEFAFTSIFAVLVCLIGFKFFGFTEFKLVSAKAASVGKSFLVMRKNRHSLEDRQIQVRLQGNLNWEGFWERTMQFCKANELNEITLDLELPWLHENFHATFHNSDHLEEGNEWFAEIPIQLADRIIGRVLLKASNSNCDSNLIITDFVDLIAEMKPELMSLIQPNWAENPATPDEADDRDEEFRSTIGISKKADSVAAPGVKKPKILDVG